MTTKKRAGRGALGWIVMLGYEAVALGTFIYLTFFDGYGYNAWNWIVAIGVNSFMAAIWPIYWLAIRWLVLGLDAIS